MRLKSKNIIVTGGASGIGLATVERCLREGANLVIADLPGPAGEQHARNLEARYSGRCLFLPVDVTSTDQVDRLIADTVAQLGSLDGVFNNAGIGSLCPADAYPDEDFLRVLDINLNGVFRVARAALRQMYRQGSGSIVNCASILGVFGQSMTAAYSAAKGGVVNLTRTLALESATKGVRVNAVGPGYIDTPLLAALDAKHAPGPDRPAPDRPPGPPGRSRQRGAVPAQRRGQFHHRCASAGGWGLYRRQVLSGRLRQHGTEIAHAHLNRAVRRNHS